MEFNLIASTIFFIIVIAFLLHKKKDHQKRAPPQAKGAWPIIGHLHLLGGSALAHRVLGDLADKNGPIYTIKLGTHQALVVSDSEITKEIFTTNDKVFASRPKSKAAEIMGYNYALVGLAPYGDYWRKVRKIIVLELLSQRCVEMLSHIRVAELNASMKGIYDSWVVKNNVREHDEMIFNSDESRMVKLEMGKWFLDMILNVVLRILSGKRLEKNNEEAVRSQNAVRNFFDLTGTFVLSDFIPYTSFLDVGGFEKKMKMSAKDMDEIIEGWLLEFKKDKESGQQQKHEGNQVFLDVLMNTLQGASKEDFFGFDHDIVIKSSCLALLIAASDSMGTTLTWAISLMLNNPSTLKIAQDEVDNHVGKHKPVERSDMKKLVYLDAIIKETLRLYPPGPLSVPHESTNDCTISGYHIPKGTRLLVNLYKLHRDPKIWANPLEFKPERFLTTHKDVDVRGKHYELIPFGAGRRVCPGDNFALDAMGSTLASLLQLFVIKTPGNKPVDMSESNGLNNIKSTPLDALLAPRLSSNMYHFGS
ncbi:strychnine-10-hydroxylase-like [Rutidosis leptorrhynchoides]|uniref:strychnine-10-hydroxylase-like n=1 Tax=Rutidosis leptorrhynchoides TaxID=125765 RepID=UPI003A98D597